MAGRIPVVHCFGRFATRAIERHAELLGDREVTVLEESTFAAALPDVEVLFGHRPPAGSWPEARRIRLIQAVGVGTDGLLPAVGLPDGVAVANTSGLSAPAMAEFTVAALLALIKRFPESWTLQQDRRWEATRPASLDGRAVLVLGAGPVGREVARLLRPFGVRLTAAARRARPVAGFDAVVRLADIDVVLPQTDDLIVALPLGPDTAGVVDRSALALLRPGGTVVNVARGGLVDETALVDALGDGRLSGAALDTVSREPLPPDDPLWRCPNLLLTAHVSWTTPGYERRLVALLAENVGRIEAGLPPRNEVDRGLGYHVIPE